MNPIDRKDRSASCAPCVGSRVYVGNQTWWFEIWVGSERLSVATVYKSCERRCVASFPTDTAKFLRCGSIASIGGIPLELEPPSSQLRRQQIDCYRHRNISRTVSPSEFTHPLLARETYDIIQSEEGDSSGGGGRHARSIDIPPLVQVARLCTAHVLFRCDRSFSTFTYFDNDTCASQLLERGSETTHQAGTKNLRSC